MVTFSLNVDARACANELLPRILTNADTQLPASMKLERVTVSENGFVNFFLEKPASAIAASPAAESVWGCFSVSFFFS